MLSIINDANVIFIAYNDVCNDIMNSTAKRALLCYIESGMFLWTNIIKHDDFCFVKCFIYIYIVYISPAL